MERKDRAAKIDGVRERVNALESAFRRRRCVHVLWVLLWLAQWLHGAQAWLACQFEARRLRSSGLPADRLPPSAAPPPPPSCSIEQRTSHDAHQLSLGVFALLSALTAGQPLAQPLAFLRRQGCEGASKGAAQTACQALVERSVLRIYCEPAKQALLQRLPCLQRPAGTRPRGAGGAVGGERIGGLDGNGRCAGFFAH